MKTDPIQIALKSVQSVLFVACSPLIAYNLFAVKVDKFGYFYNDTNQTWLAVGVGLFVAALMVRNWNKP